MIKTGELNARPFPPRGGGALQQVSDPHSGSVLFLE